MDPSLDVETLVVTDTVELGPFALHATMWAPLEAQRPAGPVLLCRDCLMAWTVTLPKRDQADWQRSLTEISEHLQAHEGEPAL